MGNARENSGKASEQTAAAEGCRRVRRAVVGRRGEQKLEAKHETKRACAQNERRKRTIQIEGQRDSGKDDHAERPRREGVLAQRGRAQQREQNANRARHDESRTVQLQRNQAQADGCTQESKVRRSLQREQEVVHGRGNSTNGLAAGLQRAFQGLGGTVLRIELQRLRDLVRGDAQRVLGEVKAGEHKQRGGIRL